MAADRERELVLRDPSARDEREDLDLVLETEPETEDDGDISSEDSGVSFLDRFLPPFMRPRG